MLNFLKLCINEFVKVVKKTSAKILILLSILAIFASVGITYINISEEKELDTYYDESWKKVGASNIESFKGERETLLSNEKVTSENIEKIASLDAKIEMYEYAVNNDIALTSFKSLTWRAKLVNEIIDEKTKLNILKATHVNSDEKINLEKRVNKLCLILENKDFNSYVDNKIENLKTDLDSGKIDNKTYEDSLYIANLTKKYEVGKNEEKKDYKEALLQEIETAKESLRSGINGKTGDLLTQSNIDKLNDDILIYEYKIENDILPSQDGLGNIKNFRSFYNNLSEVFSMAVVALFIIIVAGSAISQEISNGTIKFLTITPYKRWKILLAKLLNIIFIIVILTIILSLISILVGNIFFSKYTPEPYLYVSNGVVHSISYIPYEILKFLSFAVDVFIFGLLSFMLSTVSRNTALSVSVGIGLYMGSGIITGMINMFLSSEWLMFNPLNSIGITEKIFVNATNFMGLGFPKLDLSLQFCLITLIICCILMMVTAFDSFRKRELVK